MCNEVNSKEVMILAEWDLIIDLCTYTCVLFQ